MMRRALHQVPWLAVVLAMASPAAGEPGFAATGKDCGQNGMACRYWPPEPYDPGIKYPLIVWLHGAGQRGNDNRAHVEDWGTELLETLLSPAVRAQHPAIVMAPQCPDDNDAQWVDWPWAKGSYDIDQVAESKPLREVRSMLASLRGQYNVDPERLYVLGVSMGGFGTYDLVSRTPELFAAAVPTDGGGSPQAAARLQNLALWAFHYADDGSVPVASDREMFAALARVGARPYYSEGERGGHGAQGYAATSPGFVDWLFAQRRGVPSTPIPGLTFAPPGGRRDATTSVTISSAAIDEVGRAAAIHYTLDGSVPSATSGTLYATGISIDKSSLLTAVSTAVDDDFGERRLFHAEPYQIAEDPLPGGVVLKPAAELPSGGGGTTTSGGSSSGGSPSAAVTDNPAGGSQLSSGPRGSAGVTNSAPTGGRKSASETSGCAMARSTPRESCAALALAIAAALGLLRPRRAARRLLSS